MYILSVWPSVLKEAVKYTDYGNEQSLIKSEKDTIHVSRYSSITRQSERDRRCLRIVEELS